MKQLESQLQIACVKWFDLRYSHLKMNLFSVPSEGARTLTNGARMKAQGRRAGVADMFLAVATFHLDKYESEVIKHGLFLEFKSEKGKQNENQLAFQKAVEKQGYAYVVIKDFETFKTTIEQWLK